MCRHCYTRHLICNHTCAGYEYCTAYLIAQDRYEKASAIAKFLGLPYAKPPGVCRRPQATHAPWLKTSICEECLKKFPGIERGEHEMPMGMNFEDRMQVLGIQERIAVVAMKLFGDAGSWLAGNSKTDFSGIAKGLPAPTDYTNLTATGFSAAAGTYDSTTGFRQAMPAPDEEALRRLRSPERRMAGGYTPDPFARLSIFESTLAKPQPLAQAQVKTEVARKKVERQWTDHKLRSYIDRQPEELPPDRTIQYENEAKARAAAEVARRPVPGRKLTKPPVPERTVTADADYFSLPGARFENPSITANRPPSHVPMPAFPPRTTSKPDYMRSQTGTDGQAVVRKPLPKRAQTDLNKPLPRTPLEEHFRLARRSSCKGFRRSGSHAPAPIAVLPLPPPRPAKTPFPVRAMDGEDDDDDEEFESTEFSPVPLHPRISPLLRLPVNRAETFASPAGLSRSNAIRPPTKRSQTNIPRKPVGSPAYRVAAVPLAHPRPESKGKGTALVERYSDPVPRSRSTSPASTPEKERRRTCPTRPPLMTVPSGRAALVTPREEVQSMYGAPVGAAGLRPLLQTVNSGRPKLVTSGIFTPMAARHSVVYLDDEDNSPPECAENPAFVNEARDYFSHTPSASNFHAEPSPFTAALNQAQALNCEYVNRKHQGRSEVGPQALAADYAPGREGRSPTPNFSSNTGSRRLRDSLYFDGMTSYTTGDFITSPYLNRTVDAYAQPLHHNSFPDTLGGRTNATDSQIVDYLDSRIDSTFDFVQNFGLSSDGEEEESPFSPVPNSA